jgi:AcrR family transcriptional regulator
MLNSLSELDVRSKNACYITIVFQTGDVVPKVVDIATKRAEFVAASLDVIAGEGLAAATMRRIATQAGATTGAITHYFDGREALLLEAVATAHYAAGDRMQAAAGKHGPAADRLEAVVLEALPLDAVRLREWRVWSAFRGVLPDNARLWVENERGYGNWRGFLAALLQPICCDPEAVRREASLLVALVDGIGLRLAAMPANAKTLPEEQKQVTEDVRAYLRALHQRQDQGGRR